MGEIDLDVLGVINTKVKAIDLCLVLIDNYEITLKELAYFISVETDRRKALNENTKAPRPRSN